VQKLKNLPIDTLLFPKRALDNNLSFVFDFESYNIEKRNWQKVIDDWKKEYEENNIRAIRTKQDIDRLIFYFIDGYDYVKIYDKRSGDHINIFILDSFERLLFLSCLSVQTKEELLQMFPQEFTKVENILQNFTELGIMYQQNNRYLSLPLDYNKCMGIRKDRRYHTLMEYPELTLKLKKQ
jgi:hypothetical protein